MAKLFTLIILLFCFSTAALHAQDTIKVKQKRERYNFNQFVKETGKFVTLPGTWKREDWFKVGFLGAGTLLFFQADASLRNALINAAGRAEPPSSRKYYYSVPIVAGRVYGEWYTPTAVFLGFGTYEFLNRNSSRTVKKVSLEIFQSVVYAEAMGAILKFSVGRARPYEDTGYFRFHPFTINAPWNSFPSGHTIDAFSLSTVLSRNVKSPVLKVLCYVPAVMTLSSRIYQDQHWDSDIFAGAAIGYFTATWVVNLHEIKKPIPPAKEFSPLPSEPNEKTTPPVEIPAAKKTHFGIFAALNSCNIKGPDNVNLNLYRAGFSAGVFAKFGLSHYWAIEPELMYSYKSENLIYHPDSAKVNAIFNFNYVVLPVLAVLNLTKNTNIHGGLYIADLLSSSTRIVSANSKIVSENSAEFANNISTARFNSFDYGLTVGLGIDTKKFNYGIRYNYGLSTIGKNVDFNGQSHPIPNGTIAVVQAFVSYNIK